MLSMALMIIQLAVTVVMGLYFFRQLRRERKAEPESRPAQSRELEKLRRMQDIHLAEPLNERMRPAAFEDVIGQADGIRSLRALPA